MRSFTGLLLAVGTACLLLASPRVAASEAGRDFAQCVLSCTSARATCDRQCGDDCRALFPQSAGQRDACVSSCVQQCMATEADCKSVCKAIKNGQSPNTP